MTRSGFGRAIASRENSLGCIEILHLFIESQIKQNSQTSIEQLVIKDLLDSFERKDAALFEQKLGELLEKSPMSDDKLRRLFKVLKFPYKNSETLAAFFNLPINDDTSLLVANRFGFINNRMGATMVEDSFLSPQYGLPRWHAYHSFNQVIMGYPVLDQTANRNYLEKISQLPNEFVMSIYSDLIGKERKLFTGNLVDMLRKENTELNIDNLFFYTYKKYGSDQIHAAVSIFDSRGPGDVSAKIPIERKYPHLRLMGRDRGVGRILEIRRLAKSTESPAKMFGIIMRSLKEHVEHAGLQNSTFYAQTDSMGVEIFKKYGLKVEFSPDQLGKTDEYVMSIDGDLFILNAKRILNINENMPENPLLIDGVGPDDIDAKASNTFNRYPGEKELRQQMAGQQFRGWRIKPSPEALERSQKLIDDFVNEEFNGFSP
jgi:hypothetical protein